MIRRFTTYLFAACVMIAAGCDTVDKYPDIEPLPQKPDKENPDDKPGPDDKEEPPVNEGIVPFTTADMNHAGVTFMWDGRYIPEIRIKVSLDEWNAFLKRYDEYQNNADFFHCDVTYTKGTESRTIRDAGFRLRGNTSRRRAEGWEGQTHIKDNADWHHCHFTVNFRKYHKDDEHTIKGIRKINLKWFKDDPAYVRELYCYDLFRRYGIWTSPFDAYCRLWIHVEGDSEPAYFGVYEMIEPIDEEFIERREKLFGSDKGFLWKCVYGNVGMADLRNAEDWRFSIDKNDGVNYTYEFKGKEENFEAAKEQFKDFITKLNQKEGEDFYMWMMSVCDVEMLMKTYAVNVATGMWDDHWNNGNNFYLYFNSKDKEKYQVFFLPYDYDNTLGTSADCGIQGDAGRHDPYKWGKDGILMEKMLKINKFRQMYKDALLELIDPANDLLYVDASIARITEWQNSIRKYVSNDTGEDMEISDRPAGWSNRPGYRLLTKGSNNFFMAKEESIKELE